MATKDLDRTASSRVVLASSSPRRRELIRALDVPVELASPGGDEGPASIDETPQEFVMRLSLEKARWVGGRDRGAVVIAADTAVVLEGDVLGKPADNAEAARMLHSLRGRVHTVVTGVTLLDSRSGRRLSRAKITDVTMRHYSDREIAAYIATGEHLDKAGSYAVQDETFRPAQDVHGCYLNAVGFPLCEVVTLLEQMGVQASTRPGWQVPDQCRDCPLAPNRDSTQV